MQAFNYFKYNPAHFNGNLLKYCIKFRVNYVICIFMGVTDKKNFNGASKMKKKYNFLYFWLFKTIICNVLYNFCVMTGAVKDYACEEIS